MLEHPNEAKAVKEGQMAPNFTLYDTDGRAHELAAVAAVQPMILVFYRGDWCGWCQLQMAQLTKAYAEFEQAGVALWAISPQEQALNLAFRQKRDIPFPILEDSHLAVIDHWGLRHELNPDSENIPYPTTYIIAQGGRVHWRRMGHTKDDRPTPGEILANLP